MGGLLASEIFRLRKRLMPYVLLGLLLAIVGLLYLLLWLVVQVEAEEGTGASELEAVISLSNVLGDGMDLAYSVAGVMAIILAATLVSSEYAWGTIRTLLPRSAGRDAFMGAKAIVTIGFTLAVAITGFVGALIASWIVSTMGDFSRDLPSDFAAEAVLAILRTTLAMLPYATFAFMIALLSRSTAAGIGVGLAMYFLDDTITLLLGTAGDTGETLSEFLIDANVSALMAANHVEPPGDHFSAWRGAAVLVFYSAAFLAVSIWRFRTRDVHVN